MLVEDPLESETRGQSPPPPSHLVEAEDGDLAADVDARRADAEDAVALQATLGVDGSGGDGGRQGGRHGDGHHVEGSDDQRLPRRLDTGAGRETAQRHVGFLFHQWPSFH